MSRPASVADWKRAVFAANGVLPPAARLCLVYLADHMREKKNGIPRWVSRPRHLIAKDLGVSSRAVDKFISQAHTAGFLTTVTAGRKGTTAEYQGLFPNSPKREQSVRAKSAPQRERNVRAKSDQNVRAMSGVSANTVFAPVVPTGCLTCGDDGCAECCGGAA